MRITAGGKEEVEAQSFAAKKWKVEGTQPHKFGSTINLCVLCYSLNNIIKHKRTTSYASICYTLYSRTLTEYSPQHRH